MVTIDDLNIESKVNRIEHKIESVVFQIRMRRRKSDFNRLENRLCNVSIFQ